MHCLRLTVFVGQSKEPAEVILTRSQDATPYGSEAKALDGESAIHNHTTVSSRRRRPRRVYSSYHNKNVCVYRYTNSLQVAKVLHRLMAAEPLRHGRPRLFF